MAEVLLIEPDHKTGLNFFPWGILSLGSYLKHIGIDVSLLPGTYYSSSEFEALFQELVPQAPIVGLTCFSTDVAIVKKLVDRIKADYPEKKIVVGGPHAILLPESTLAYKNIDFVVSGPGEEALEGIVRQDLGGGRDFESIPGIGFKREGTAFLTRKCSTVPEYPIDFSLLPERKTRNMSKYVEFLSGRGCSFVCTFCYNAVCGHKWIGKSAARMVEELQGIVDEFDPEMIMFQDDNFFHSKERVYEFIELYRARGFSFRWAANCRANYFSKNYVNSDLLRALEDINCHELRFGMESGSQRILDILKKGIKLSQMYRVVDLMSKSPIVGNYSFLMGVPGETVDDYKMTMEFIKHIAKKDATAIILGPQYYRIYPGGELYNSIIAEYDFTDPKSFEDWAEVVRDDYFGLSKGFDYPWIDDVKFPRYADILVLLARKPISDLLSTVYKAPGVIFALLARLRLKTGWYSAMWDMQLASYLFRQYAEHIGKPKMLKVGERGR
jgi:radical SAM superfamily enzyme YgiQ (UPF0313 family)